MLVRKIADYRLECLGRAGLGDGKLAGMGTSRSTQQRPYGCPQRAAANDTGVRSNTYY